MLKACQYAQWLSCDRGRSSITLGFEIDSSVNKYTCKKYRNEHRSERVRYGMFKYYISIRKGKCGARRDFGTVLCCGYRRKLLQALTVLVSHMELANSIG